MITEILAVLPQDSGMRLDVFIAKELDDFSRSRAKKSIDAGDVSINDEIQKKSGALVKAGDKVIVSIKEPVAITATPQDLPLDIIYQDNDLAVINKAQGMVTHPATGSPCDTLVNAIMYHIKDLSSINGVIRPGIVHRLDKDTSGLLVVAKNDLAHNSLAKQIADKTAHRIYIALVDGNIKEDSGTIEMPIGRSRSNRKLMAVVSNGRWALTRFRVLERFGEYTLVEYQLETGRTHQIRVHAKYSHHTVVGDISYGGSDKFGLNGQLLHSYKLTFEHPTAKEQMEFFAPLPDYFENVLAKLRNKAKIPPITY